MGFQFVISNILWGNKGKENLPQLLLYFHVSSVKKQERVQQAFVEGNQKQRYKKRLRNICAQIPAL